MRRDMTFQSKGLTCRGWFYMPDGLGQGQKAPTIVMAHGFSIEGYERAREPKRLVIMPGGHFDVSSGAAVEWFTQQLG